MIDIGGIALAVALGAFFWCGVLVGLAAPWLLDLIWRTLMSGGLVILLCAGAYFFLTRTRWGIGLMRWMGLETR
jgi:hypothetical protein